MCLKSSHLLFVKQVSKHLRVGLKMAVDVLNVSCECVGSIIVVKIVEGFLLWECASSGSLNDNLGLNGFFRDTTSACFFSSVANVLFIICYY